MTDKNLETIKYLVSGEDSRKGRVNYWTDVYLAEKTPFKRFTLGFSKVALWTAISMGMTIFVSHILA